MVRVNMKTLCTVLRHVYMTTNYCAANVANSAFYCNHVITSRSIATSKQKHPAIL